MIIAISGLIGCGKDTAADYLVNLHEFRRESFAGNLKDAMCNIFGWDREMLEGRSKSSREWREQVDPWWAERLNIPHLTPRWILQHVGTDVIRGNFHDDMWLASLENKLRTTDDHIVISDVRFKNEVAMLKNLGAICVEVVRGERPTWYDMAIDGNVDMLEDMGIHRSEYDWIGTKFDNVLNNNGTLDDLYSQIEQLIVAMRPEQYLQASMSNPASV
jgi:hypothetical protein